MSYFGRQRVPHSWASNGKTPVAVGGPCTSDGAGHRVRRTELTRTDVGDKLSYLPSTTVPGDLDTVILNSRILAVPQTTSGDVVRLA